MIVWIYRVYCLRPHGRRLAKHTALSEYLDGFNSCRRHTPLLYPAGLRRCWQFVFIQGFLSCQYGVRAFVPFPSSSLFPVLSWVGSVSVWGRGGWVAFTPCYEHTAIFCQTKIGEPSRSLLLGPDHRGAAGDSRMKMFQGFGKVDLPKLKWRSERCDDNARAMGGVLAAWGMAVKRQSLRCWASGRWPPLLALSQRKNCFQCPAIKPSRP